MNIWRASTKVTRGVMPPQSKVISSMTTKKHRVITKTYLFVIGPTNGLVISCTVALEANSIPTLTFSLISLLVERGQSVESGGSCAAVGVRGSRSVVRAVVLNPDNLTVLSYKDTMLWKDAGESCFGAVLFLSTSVDSSRVYR